MLKVPQPVLASRVPEPQVTLPLTSELCKRESLLTLSSGGLTKILEWWKFCPRLPSDFDRSPEPLQRWLHVLLGLKDKMHECDSACGHLEINTSAKFCSKIHSSVQWKENVQSLYWVE